MIGFRTRAFALGLGSSFVLALACAGDEGCKPGTEFCECLAGACFDGLVCTGTLCVDFGGADEAGTSPGSESTSDSNDSATTDSTDTTSEITSADATTDFDEGTCGWNVTLEGYWCNADAPDPNGTPIECPPNLVAGESCMFANLPATGCCDEYANLWRCSQNGALIYSDCM